jgi:hypothetical protein
MAARTAWYIPRAEHLDALLDVGEERLAALGELHAALVEGDRLFEGEGATLELGGDRLELGEEGLEALGLSARGLEVERGLGSVGVRRGHESDSTRARLLASRQRTSMVSPTATSEARATGVPSW